MNAELDYPNPNYGNADVSPVVGALAIATKGHFYHVSPFIKVPLIYNSCGDLVGAEESTDDTSVGVEKFSGINFQTRLRT